MPKRFLKERKTQTQHQLDKLIGLSVQLLVRLDDELDNLRNTEYTTPNLARRLRIIGNWKLKPKANINFITNDKYSLSLASNWIGKFVLKPELSNDKKNFIARGIIK